MEPYAIFLDIDGTLSGRGGIPDENVREIQRVQRLGHKVFLCTGRSKAYLPEGIMKRISPDGIVAGIGTYVEYRGEVLLSVAIPKSVLHRIVTHFIEREIFCVLEGEEECIAVCDPHHREWEVYSAEELDARFPKVRISKVTVMGVLTEADKNALLPEVSVIQHPSYAEGTTAGYQKSTGISVVLKHLGIPREHSVGMGDSDNDLDMLSFVGHSVAMGNANDRVKNACETVTASAEEAGVAEAVRKLFPETNCG